MEKGEVFDGCREQVVYGLIINSLFGQDGLDGLDDWVHRRGATREGELNTPFSIPPSHISLLSLSVGPSLPTPRSTVHLLTALTNFPLWRRRSEVKKRPGRRAAAGRVGASGRGRRRLRPAWYQTFKGRSWLRLIICPYMSNIYNCLCPMVSSSHAVSLLLIK